LTFAEYSASNPTANATHFGVTDVQDEDSSISNTNVLNDRADRAQILVNTSDTGVTDSGFSEGDTATIQINTQSGGTTELRLVVPESLSGSSAVNLN
jgi:flagellin FlaB